MCTFINVTSALSKVHEATTLYLQMAGHSECCTSHANSQRRSDFVLIFPDVKRREQVYFEIAWDCTDEFLLRSNKINFNTQ